MTLLLWRQLRVNAVLVPGVALAFYALLSAVNSNGGDYLTPGMTYVLQFVPPLLGVLLGVPVFSREYANGTHTLALTQSISQRRWIATRITFAAGLAAVIALVISVAYTLVRGSLADTVTDRLEIAGAYFYLQGLTPIAYAVFAVVLGAVLGLALRNATLAAVGTVIVYIVVRLYLSSPTPCLANSFFEPVGKCMDMWAPGRRQHTTPTTADAFYPLFPAGTGYWTFQLLQSLLFLALGGALVGVALWFTRRQPQR